MVAACLCHMECVSHAHGLRGNSVVSWVEAVVGDVCARVEHVEPGAPQPLTACYYAFGCYPRAFQECPRRACRLGGQELLGAAAQVPRLLVIFAWGLYLLGKRLDR